MNHAIDPIAFECFAGTEAQRLAARRLEHLSSLGLGIRECTVLEAGAGVGDLTAYFLDRKCRVLATDGREAFVETMRRRHGKHPGAAVGSLDLSRPELPRNATFDVVHCWSVLHLLANPAQAVVYLGRICSGLLLFEGVVDTEAGEHLRFVKADLTAADGTLAGKECRFTRAWIRERIRESMPYVYEPVTPPFHPDYARQDAASAIAPGARQRAVLIGARREITAPGLVPA